MSKAYVYLTTNLLNGMRYVGKHRYNGFDPNYYGSGKLLGRAINKYGIKNFSVEVIKYFDSEEEAYSYEYELIKELGAIEDPNYYNLVPGGYGFREGDVATKGTVWMNNGEKQARVPEDKIELFESKGYSFGSLNNHLAGRIHITDGEHEKLVTSDELNDWLSSGWHKGRSDSWNPGTKGFVAIEKDGIKTRVHPDKLSDYLVSGWTKSILSIPPNHAGEITIHKDSKMKIVNESELSEYLNNGWELGRAKSTTKGRKWVHKIVDDQVIRRMVPAEEFEEYLSNGWLKGSAMKMAGIPRPRVGKNKIVVKGDKARYINADRLELYESNGWVANN